MNSVVADLTAAGCAFWVAGGWGVDALVGHQTRAHRDLDLAVGAADEGTVLRVLDRRGYVVETDWRPVRVELVAPGRGWVDLHPVAFDADGHGRQAGHDGTHFDYPPGAFTSGMLDGSTVPCLSRAQQIRFHSGYAPRTADRHDLALLGSIGSRGARVRRATPADLEALLDVQQEGAVRAFAHIFPQTDHPFPRADIRARWSAEMADPDIDTFVAVDAEGQVVGFAATCGMQLLHFGTALETWGGGLAQQVHDHVLSRLTSGRTAERPWLRVMADNQRARRFYERLGWRATGEETRSPFAPYPLLLTYERP